jgi:phosphatidylserine/phosphatidylglycerophosphate/cardiolipin synthase-like enzyme
VEPGSESEYKVEAMYGPVGNLTPRYACTVAVKTEAEDDGRNAVYFNRGAVGSQAYTRHFGNIDLKDDERLDPANEKVRFLSRGLLDGFLKFVNDTKPGEALRVVAYEHSYLVVLRALKVAHDRGVSLEMVYDAKQPKSHQQALEDAGLTSIHGNILFQRTNEKNIPHNKFIVRVDAGGTAVAVWTGSTNFTPSGFLGQTNVGHVTYDRQVADKYLLYFKLLKGDPIPEDAIPDVEGLTPNPPNVIPPESTVAVFSPRSTNRMLGWYAARAADAQSVVLFTAPFAVDQHILESLAKAKDSTSFLLLEKPPAPVVRAARDHNPARLALAYGAALGEIWVKVGEDADGKPIFELKRNTAFDRWFLQEERDRNTGNRNIFYVHTKILVIDPLSDDPLVCTGSANFSDNSLKVNDENMLLIRGDTRVADIYLTEIDRLFRHFSFRDVAARDIKKPTPESLAKAYELDEEGRWWWDSFETGSFKCQRREMFFAESERRWSDVAADDPEVFGKPLPKPEIPGYVAAPKGKDAAKKGSAAPKPKSKAAAKAKRPAAKPVKTAAKKPASRPAKAATKRVSARPTKRAAKKPAPKAPAKRGAKNPAAGRRAAPRRSARTR